MSTRKLLVASAFACMTAALPSLSLRAQDQAELATKRDQKLESEFLKLADWVTDFAEAQAVAAETGKPIFAYFTRSYAPCPPCSALEKGPLSEELFKYFGQDVVLFCHVTSHVEEDKDQDLLRQKGGSAFPYLAFLDAAGNVIAKPKERTVDSFHDAVEHDVTAYFDLVSAAEGGDADAAARLFEKRVEFGHFSDFEAARAEMARQEALSPARRARLEQALVAQEFNHILGTVRGEAEAAAGGAKTLPMLEKGRIPKDPGLAFYYWAFLAQHAAETGNADLLGRCIEELGAHSRARPLLPRLQKAYDGLRKKG
jgi:hypothetical protein